MDLSTEDFFYHGWTQINTDGFTSIHSFIRVHPCASVVHIFFYIKEVVQAKEHQYNEEPSRLKPFKGRASSLSLIKSTCRMAEAAQSLREHLHDSASSELEPYG